MRKKRQKEKGCKYYILSRVNRGERIFKSEFAKMLIMATIERAKNKYRFMLFNFNITENKIHLIIEPLEDENISVIMHWILFVFAINYNKEMKISGHVWQNRFVSRIINTITDYLNEFIFISRQTLNKKTISLFEYQYSAIYYLKNNIAFLNDKPPEKMLYQIFDTLVKI